MWLEDLKIRRLLSSFNHKKKEDRKHVSGAKKLTPTKPSEVNHNEEY
jgi:hypothetical protein